MKRMHTSTINLFGTLLLIGSVFGCGQIESPTTSTDQAEPSNEQEFEWLLGTWSDQDPMGEFSETWFLEPLKADTEGPQRNLQGHGLVRVGTDTVFEEHLQIAFIEGHWNYVAIVADQNDGEAIKFLSDSISERYVHFANYEHDFPQEIAYKLIADTLHIDLKGVENDEPRQEEFILLQNK